MLLCGRYQAVVGKVNREVNQLRVVLEGLEAREKEREWLRNQPFGELDDTRLVDGIAGDKNIHRRRGKPEQQLGLFVQKPVSRCVCLHA